MSVAVNGARLRATTAACLLLAALALLGLAGCRSGSPSGAASAPTKPNVVFILLDALRLDHLGCYGYKAISTPNIDALAQEGVRFTNLFSNAPWTGPSVGSFFSSSYPSECGFGRVPGDDMMALSVHNLLTLEPPGPTLAECMRAGGYRTAVFSGTPMLASPYSAGLDRGFEKSWIPAEPAVAQVVTEEVLHWMSSEAKEPFFLYVHYIDPHAPYNPPQLPPGPRGSRENWLRSRIMNVRTEKQEFSPEDRALLRYLYDQQIVYVDQALGRLLGGIRAPHWSRPMVVFVTADHGEELWEHGRCGHGHTLYDEALRVPGILVLPGGQWRGRVEKRAVRLLDIAPTLAELAGLPPPKQWRGTSWLPLLRKPGRGGDREVRAECLLFAYESKCVRTSRFKVIAKPLIGKGETYDLVQDRQEQHNLGANYKPAARLHRILRKWMDQMVRDATEKRSHVRPRPRERRELTPQQREVLRGLGYVAQ